MAAIERRQRSGRRGAVRWRVRWRDSDGRERSKTFDTEDARRFRLRLEGDVAADTWIDPAHARIPLREFVDEWRKSIVDAARRASHASTPPYRRSSFRSGGHGAVRHQQPQDRLEAVRIAAEVVKVADEVLEQRVLEARAFRRTSADIAEQIGITRQSAHRRWRHLDEPAEELLRHRERLYRPRSWGGWREEIEDALLSREQQFTPTDDDGVDVI